MKRTDSELAAEALFHLEVIRRHLQLPAVDHELIADAVSLRLASVVETLARMSEPVREELFGTEWAQMRGLRNRIAHGYFDIDYKVVLATAQDRLPAIERSLRERF